MRTSMILPDALLAEAKTKAAAEGSTVTQLVIEGLRVRLSGAIPDAVASASLPSRALGPARVNLSDNAAVLDILDADESARP